MATIEKSGTRFELTELSDERWSLLAPEGVDGEAVEWPTDQECSAIAGVALETFDSGDHPTRSEAILHVARDAD